MLGVSGFFSFISILTMMFNSPVAPLIALVPFWRNVTFFIGFDILQLSSIYAQSQGYVISIGLICSGIFTYLNSERGSLDKLYMFPFVAQGLIFFTACFIN